MKTAKRIISCFIALVLTVSVCPFIYAEDSGEREVRAFTDDDFLTCKGRNLVNRKGEKVVLKGVTLGRACVVGAGAVVAKDVPAGIIVAGNPAKTIKSLAQQRKITQ